MQPLDEYLLGLSDTKKADVSSRIALVALARLEDHYRYARVMIMAILVCGAPTLLLLYLAPESSGQFAGLMFFLLGAMAIVTKPTQPKTAIDYFQLNK